MITNQEFRIILFQVDNLWLFARLDDVLEILEIQNIRKLPGSKFYMDGLFEYRGKILPYFNTLKRFHFTDKRGYLSFVFRQNDFNFGFKVDKTLGTYFVNKTDIFQPTMSINDVPLQFIKSALLLEGVKVLELDYRKLFIS